MKMTTPFKQMAAGAALTGFLLTGALVGVGYAQARASLTNGAVVTIRQILSGTLAFAAGTSVLASSTTGCTAGTVPYSFTGDTNTGVGRSAADAVVLCAGGSVSVTATTTGVSSTLPVTHGGALALGTTSTNGVVLQNTTAAAAGAQQISPRLAWIGRGWKTDATAASQTVQFHAEVLPVEGAAAPTGTWQLGTSINGGAVTYPLSISSTGDVTVLGAFFGGNDFRIPAGALFYWNGRARITSPANGQLNLTNAAENAGVGWDVTTDAVAKLRTRAQSAYATIDALGYSISGNVAISTTAPTVTGFAGTASVTANNGTFAFLITTGTADATSTGTITLPAATTGWFCTFADVTTPQSYVVSQTGGNTTTVTVTNYARTTGIAAAWLTSEAIRGGCHAY